MNGLASYGHPLYMLSTRPTNKQKVFHEESFLWVTFISAAKHAPKLLARPIFKLRQNLWFACRPINIGPQRILPYRAQFEHHIFLMLLPGTLPRWRPCLPPLLTIIASSPATVVTDHVLPADLPCCLASRISFLDADVDRAISAPDLLPRLCSPPHRKSRWAKNAAPKSTTPNQRVNPPSPQTKVDEYFIYPLLLYAFDFWH